MVCHLFPQRWWTLNVQSRGNHWPGGPRDMLTTTSARVNSSPASLSHLQDGIFYKYVVFKHALSLWPNFSTAATPWMGLVDIHIQGLWDAFPSLRDCLFQTIEKGHFKFAILFVAWLCYTHTHTRAHTYTHTIILLVELVIFLCIKESFIVIVYKFVFVCRLVLNVHFVHAVLQLLFVSHLLLICCISSLIYFTGLIHSFVLSMCLFYLNSKLKH